ncbi:PepSY domain-containing protein [Flavihumibacter sp. R14]|nr:PepSY domain-containing protein [Flavihumibacter soli]
MKSDQVVKKDKKLLWRIHHWAGLYFGIVIAVLSITGALAVFIPEIDLLIQKQYYNVSSSPSDKLNINRSVERVKAQYPDMSGLLVDLPEKAGQVAGLNFFVKGETKADQKRYYFFVDAGSDLIVGSRDQQNSLANYLRQIHVRLYEGFWGRQLVGLAGIALLVLAVTGLLIYRDFMKRQPYPKVRQGRGLRIVLADWHKLLGISALAFNLVIAITGGWLGLQPKLMTWFDMKTPNNFKAPEVVNPEADRKTMIQWDEVMEASKKQFPDLSPTAIRGSDDGSSTVTLVGDIKGQVYERNANMLVLSKTDLKPVFKYDIREQPFSHKFYFVQEALHFGNFGGLGLKILYTILGLTSGFLSISGFIVYLYRMDKKKERRLSPLKTTFLYIISIILVLVALALVSMFIGYSVAASASGMIINGSLAILLLYGIFTFFRKKLNPVAI